ncbi:hypothetical protein BG003_010403 [Podila horticola]|nr:hypothetical protein BG003_010403 [Podila horticola]
MEKQESPESILPTLSANFYTLDKQELSDSIPQNVKSDDDDDDDDNSQIEEVRVTVTNRDDPSIPYNTFRVWFLGLALTAIVAFSNQFFYLRQSTMSLTLPIYALISLPLGHLMAALLPSRDFHFFKWSFSLNPAPFSIKEHVVIGVMSNCASLTAYAVNVVIMQKFYLDQEKPFIASLFLVLSTQFLGYGMAGVLRRFLVRPPQMLWPMVLVNVALYRSLNAKRVSPEDQGRMPMMRYFALLTFAMFVYHWLPGFVFPTIGTLSVLCWIKPTNAVLSQLTGSYGLGIGTIALDWSVLSYLQPLTTPLFAQFNILIGLVLFAYIAVPLAYYTNLWGAKLYPIAATTLFRANGSAFQVSSVHINGTLDEAAYELQGPVRMSTMLLLSYGFGFAALAATIVHVPLFHGKELSAMWKSTTTVGVLGKEDIHERLMRAYPEVPDWWYSSLFTVMLLMSLVTCVVWDYMPWWGLVLSVLISAVFVLPMGIIQALTNQVIALNIIAEYIIGYILPGNPLANVTFKTYGYITNVQALSFVSSLKFGHYMKIPPRMMFAAQIWATMVAAVVNLLTATWLMQRPDMCKDGGPFLCRSSNVFNSAATIWGAIGPARFFGNKDGGIYSAIQWGFVLGAVLPVVFWKAVQKWPKQYWLQYIHWPVILSVATTMPPLFPHMYTNGLAVGVLFGYILRKYRFRWWSRYNYATAAAFDTGIACATLAIFFMFQTRYQEMPVWWGNPESGYYDRCPLGGNNFYGKAPYEYY